MAELIVRAGILLALIIVLAIATWMGRQLVASRKRRALAAVAPASLVADGMSGRQGVRILVFGSEDCAQCHTLQEPALARVLAERRDGVSAVHVDAPSSPELTDHYGILTLPSTVVLTPEGRTHAANFGFASSDKLLAQVDDALQSTALAAVRPADRPEKMQPPRKVPSSAR